MQSGCNDILDGRSLRLAQMLEFGCGRNAVGMHWEWNPVAFGVRFNAFVARMGRSFRGLDGFVVSIILHKSVLLKLAFGAGLAGFWVGCAG